MAIGRGGSARTGLAAPPAAAIAAAAAGADVEGNIKPAPAPTMLPVPLGAVGGAAAAGWVAWIRVRMLRSLLECPAAASGVDCFVGVPGGDGVGRDGDDEEIGGPRGGVGRRGGRPGTAGGRDDDDVAPRPAEGDGRTGTMGTEGWDWLRCRSAREMALDQLAPSSCDSDTR